MRKASLTLGVVTGLFSIVLWVIMIFYNPYSALSSMDVALNTFVMLVLPACLAIISSIMNKKYLMLLAFIWSLPVSLYLMLTPGIFSWFIASSVVYCLCFLLMFFPKNNSLKLVN